MFAFNNGNPEMHGRLLKEAKLRVLVAYQMFFVLSAELMRTIHTSMTSTFQCEYCQCFITFKRCDKFKLKCTSHGGMYGPH